jgi:hypothetical protein
VAVPTSAAAAANEMSLSEARRAPTTKRNEQILKISYAKKLLSIK